MEQLQLFNDTRYSEQTDLFHDIEYLEWLHKIENQNIEKQLHDLFWNEQDNKLS